MTTSENEQLSNRQNNIGGKSLYITVYQTPNK